VPINLDLGGYQAFLDPGSRWSRGDPDHERDSVDQGIQGSPAPLIRLIYVVEQFPRLSI